jgi:hypothetical protein
MDQATQQNAALVEEMAAAASSLKSQAGDLVQTVAVFKLSGGDHRPGGALLPSTVRTHKPGAPPFKGPERRELGVPKGAAARGHANPSPKPAGRTAAPAPARPAPAAGNDDWETF